MTLDAVLIGFAFTAGAVAFLNPCGFAMLPTYVSYFIQSDSSSSFPTSTPSLNFNTTTKRNTDARLISVKKLAKGALIGLLVTAAFIAVFGLAGLAISAIGIGVANFLPWIAVSSGVLIIGIGVAKIFGKTFHINIPSPTGFIYISGTNTNNKRKSSFVNFFLFGIGYAIASLSCTLPIFLLIVFQGLSAGGIGEGSVVFLTYALAMGSVLTAISFAISLSNQIQHRGQGAAERTTRQIVRGFMDKLLNEPELKYVLDNIREDDTDKSS
jgi:cytochrome c-type biogenesis protein